ncbi:DUF4012 domain-containing protein [Bifidobacterium catenulatum]|uniref:DUF4012 domain-containing protein n=1 Tax=Bifidobacterium catenulatum TaxID=1686 RepID=A0AAW5ZZQ2_9BIFI|nr:DUF4012 domain-containing protein [Bifidobacterium catenulatum]MDB1161905.1 DUF4012 domain-containing protein [Bifidobacterium catenulatum]
MASRWDGVIAIDPLFLQNMLAVTGGVTMPDGSVLDGTNTAQMLLNIVYAKMTPEKKGQAFRRCRASCVQPHHPECR